MKTLLPSKSQTARAARPRRARAFTVSEMMVAVFIFVFMVVGIIYAMLAGMRYDELVCSKLGASEKSRMSFDQLGSDIRSAKIWSIGNGNNTSYTACGNLALQKGTALQLWSSSTDTNAYVRYWFDTNSCQLYRLTNNVATYQIIAQSLTNTGMLSNSMCFHAERYDGTPAQDLEYKYVLVTTMEFCQYQYPLTRVGPGYYYNYYTIQFKTASHCPN